VSVIVVCKAHGCFPCYACGDALINLPAAFVFGPKPSAALPPGSPRIGSKKAKSGKAERGYRVVTSIDAFDDAELGVTFATPDVALSFARKLAKAERRAYVILAAGKLRWTIYGDGSDSFHEETRT
jgi:hypothetical protein